MRDEAAWERLWQDSPQRSAFARLDYVRAAAAAAGLSVALHFVEEDGELAAGAAVTWRKRGPYRAAVVPPFTPYSALLLRSQPSESDIHAQSSALNKILVELERSYDLTILHLHPSVADVRAATWRGWKTDPLYTYVRRAAERELLDGWSEGTARAFRAARSDYEIIEGDSAAAAAMRLCRESYARHRRRPPLSVSALEQFVRQTASNHRAFGAVTKDGDVEAAIVMLSDPARSYYWVAGSRPGHAMTVLVGEVLSRLETPVWDFMGANTPGIAEFKRRFGCELESYHRITFYSRKDVALLHHLRTLFRT